MFAALGIVGFSPNLFLFFPFSIPRFLARPFFRQWPALERTVWRVEKFVQTSYSSSICKILTNYGLKVHQQIGKSTLWNVGNDFVGERSCYLCKLWRIVGS